MTRVSVIGGSGYVGGELLRLLIFHSACELQIVTSQRYAGEPIHRVHSNLRGLTTLRFKEHNVETTAADSDRFTHIQ